MLLLRCDLLPQAFNIFLSIRNLCLERTYVLVQRFNGVLLCFEVGLLRLNYPLRLLHLILVFVSELL